MLAANSRLPLLPSLVKNGGGSSAILLANHFSSSATDVPVNVPEPSLSSTNVAQFRKGAGGRNSFSGNVVTVFGNTGWTALPLINRLAKHGNQLILPYRCDPYYMREHKVSCELGQVLFFPYQLKDEDSIRKAVKYSNTVINLIGSCLDTPNFSMYDTNVEGARRIARICREMGVERLVHVSAMNADPEHKSRFLKNGSFLKTKGLGEQAVRSEYPSATIVRPAVMYGEFDSFIYKMLTRWRKGPLDWVYIYNGGHGIYKMPLFVNDFSNGLVRAAMDPIAAGKTYEFVGPYCYEMCELMDYMFIKGGAEWGYGYNYRRIGFRDPWFLASSLLNWAHNKFWRRNTGFINWEWLDFVEATSDVLTGGDTLTLKDLGVTNLTEFENMGAWHCLQRSFIRQFELDPDEYPNPPLPLRSPPLIKQRPPRFSAKDVHTEKRAFGLSAGAV